MKVKEIVRDDKPLFIIGGERNESDKIRDTKDYMNMYINVYKTQMRNNLHFVHDLNGRSETNT